LKRIEASIGTMVRATKSDETSENVMDKASPRVSRPVMPVAKTIGRKTTIVVSVEAVMAIPTSLVPIRAASLALFPSWTWRNMFSMTTMALSTSIPIPSASPPRVRRFSV
jgi:hypothetical protein